MKLMWVNLFTMSPICLSFSSLKKEEKLISTCSNKKWLNMIMSLVLNIVLKLLYCEFITRSTRKCLLLQFSHIYFFFALHLLPQYILIWLYDRKKFISWNFSFSLANIASHRVNWFYFILCCKFPLHSIFLLINSFIASSRDVFFSLSHRLLLSFRNSI